MDIKELIKLSATKSKKFSDKYTYWVCKRGKAPDLEWLMPLIEEVLGEDYVREQAKRYIETQEVSFEKPKNKSGD